MIFLRCVAYAITRYRPAINRYAGTPPTILTKSVSKQRDVALITFATSVTTTDCIGTQNIKMLFFFAVEIMLLRKSFGYSVIETISRCVAKRVI